MPLYEYQCDACEYFFEEYQSLHEAPLKKCPSCKKKKLMKLISLTSRPVVPNDPREEFAKIKREAKEIAKRITKGDQDAIADVYGSDVANGKPLKRKTDATKNPKSKVKRIT